MDQNSTTTYLLTIGLLLLIIILIGGCAARSKTLNKPKVPEMPGDKELETGQKNYPALVREVAMETEAFLILSQLAAGETEGLEYQCVILDLNGVKELEGRNIGVRVFLNLPEADQQTSYESPHFVTSFSFGHTDTSIPKNFKFNLKNTVSNLGGKLLKDLNQGVLNFTLVPYYFFPDKVEDPRDIDLRVAELKLTLDCE